tara:strand:+ start:63 stop:452 length:390 start_codon:yes stop_codon:yes gene_type:complete
MKKILTIFIILIVTPSLVFAKEVIWTCIDENEFITTFKIDEYKNLVIHLGSMVDEDEPGSNAGESYNIKQKLNVLNWSNNQLIVSDTDNLDDIYIRIFDFESSTNTILVFTSGSEKPWVMISKCFLSDF